jgi:predicted RNase H-like HicB family nuclease
MHTYNLYLESGPMRRKTMVHVLELPGCVAVGPTTDEAIAAAPEAIRVYLRFSRRHGEEVDPDAPFGATVAEHITEGEWLGNGSSSLVFAPDLLPATAEHIEACLRRFRQVREELAAWAAAQTEQDLAGPPAGGGRPAKAVLLHIVGGPGGYLSAVVGGSKGFSSVAGQAERGQLALPEALLRIVDLTEEVVRATTPEQRAAVVERPGNPRTLRKALRRSLEHDWEHYAELARRPGGPGA